MGEPYGPHPLGRRLGWVGNMAHIGQYYGPYCLFSGKVVQTKGRLPGCTSLLFLNIMYPFIGKKP